MQPQRQPWPCGHELRLLLPLPKFCGCLQSTSAQTGDEPPNGPHPLSAQTSSFRDPARSPQPHAQRPAQPQGGLHDPAQLSRFHAAPIRAAQSFRQRPYSGPPRVRYPAPTDQSDFSEFGLSQAPAPLDPLAHRAEPEGVATPLMRWLLLRVGLAAHPLFLCAISLQNARSLRPETPQRSALAKPPPLSCELLRLPSSGDRATCLRTGAAFHQSHGSAPPDVPDAPTAATGSTIAQ